MDKPPQHPWDPYSKDCSLGYCSYYCPQWCFFLFPPPPPPPPSRPLLSPLLIAIIAVVSTVFLLVAYYAILTHHRRRRRRAAGPAPLSELDQPAPWHASGHEGLDDTLINKISACQYRSGGGLLLDGTDCSVCLSQFEDGDHIRLLPKCTHPFHLSCIDSWLKSHSTCPICRASIFPLPTNMPVGPVITHAGSESEPEPEPVSNRNMSHENGVEAAGQNESNYHDIVEIEEGRRVIGRSFSMDSTLLRRQTDADADAGTGSSSRWTRALHSVLSPVRMKRSRSLRSALPTST